MLIDSHIHVGQFMTLYYSPSYVCQLMDEIDVGYFLVSSTSMCEENYEKVLSELRELIRLNGEMVLPVMWITPDGLKGNIAWFLESEIRWRCLKIHPFLHPKDWNPTGFQFAEVIDIARELGVPLLIHTGNEECCRANRYESLIRENQDVIFILAHGRPQDDALKIVAKYDNAYADSAFMPVDCMKEFIDKNLSPKLLWGTDMCIPQYFYPEINLSEYYTNKLSLFRSVCTPQQYDLVTYKNALNVFNIRPKRN